MSKKDWLETIRNIYKLRITWVMTILGIASILLYFLDYFVIQQAAQPSPSAIWLLLKNAPIKAIADACLTSLLVGFAYEWVVRKESEATLIELIRQQITEQKEEILHEIPQALMINPKVVSTILKRSKVEEVIRTGLQTILEDDQMGAEIYNGFFKRTMNHDQRRTNYRVKISLSLIRDSHFTDKVKNKYYIVTIDRRYETTLTKNKLAFRCEDSLDTKKNPRTILTLN